MRATTIRPDASGAIHVPDGYDLAGLLALLNQRVQGGKPALHYAEFRRWVSKHEPLIFQLIYLPHHLRRPETQGRLSFSSMHVEIGEVVKVWRDPVRPGGSRVAIVGPRFSGKSTSCFCSHPLWATCHGHRQFVAAFADSGDQARRHLKTLRDELQTNELLAHDFPELCAPVVNTSEMWQSRSGAVMVARGLDAKTLGLKVGAVRPDVLLLDDPEGADGQYSVEQAESRLRTIRQSVLAMNPDAAVVWTGTSTMFGGLAHQLVRHALGEGTAAWITETGFGVRYFPALVRDADGVERSLWPQRWSTEYLLAERARNPRDFARDFQNLPVGADGKFWTRDDFRYSAKVPVDARVMWVDPAVTGNKTSDETGIAVVGVTTGGGECVVELAEGLRGSVDVVRSRVHQLVAANRSIRLVVVENNQGGMLWDKALGPLPGGARLEMARATVGKAERFADVHRLYQQGRVAHAQPLRALEDQACAFPFGRNDDVLDAACGAILYLMENS